LDLQGPLCGELNGLLEWDFPSQVATTVNSAGVNNWMTMMCCWL